MKSTDRSGTGEPGELLAGFLAANDVACPACGYNLRGVVSATCPECGLALHLGVQETGALGRRWGLLLLIFAWLLLAGTMNDYRALRSIHSTVYGQQFATIASLPNVTWTVPSGTLRPSRSIIVDRDEVASRESAARTVEPVTGLATAGSEASTAPEAPPAPAPPATAEEPDPVDAAVAALEQSVEAAIGRIESLDLEDAAIAVPQGSVKRSIQLSFPSAAQPVAPRWGAVTWSQWLRASWWTLLALTAVTGIVLLAWHHRRPASRLVARTLTAVAWCAFTGYFAYHLVSFVEELL
ncbi:MAG: hypothetical protein ACYTJ0_16730 [Planctomycetota bacterium]|jgi:hypothetical protein